MPFFEGAQGVENSNCEFKDIQGDHNIYNNSVHNAHKGDNVTHNTNDSYNDSSKHSRSTRNSYRSHKQTAPNYSANLQNYDAGAYEKLKSNGSLNKPQRVSHSYHGPGSRPNMRMIDNRPAHSFFGAEDLTFAKQPSIRGGGDVEMEHATNANRSDRLGTHSMRQDEGNLYAWQQHASRQPQTAPELPHTRSDPIDTLRQSQSQGSPGRQFKSNNPFAHLASSAQGSGSGSPAQTAGIQHKQQQPASSGWPWD